MLNEKLDKNAEAQRKFFNEKAPSWRENNNLTDKQIASLLSVIPLKSGDTVLDVACGTGVLDRRLISMGLKVDAIDVSDKMIERAKRNNADLGVNYRVADFYRLTEYGGYECLLVFDSYPHFPDKHLFAKKAACLLKDGGMLWIFFDQSKEAINGRHSAHSAEISSGLRSAEEEAEVFKAAFEVVRLYDGDDGYYIGLKKKFDK